MIYWLVIKELPLNALLLFCYMYSTDLKFSLNDRRFKDYESPQSKIALTHLGIRTD